MATCPHCRSDVPSDCPHVPYCCAGCREVAALLKDEGLGRYYDLAGRDVVPAAPVANRSQAWLEPLVAESEAAAGPVCRLELDVQGVHCAGCVWLMNELFRRAPGGASITVNPALGKLRLAWQRGRFDVGRFLAAVERFGYRFGPSRKHVDAASRDLPVRIGICAALTMNVMIFSWAFYAGLGPSEVHAYSLFGTLVVGMSAAVVAVGGWPFFKSAAEALRRGVLHLDLPIAGGILLAFGTSLVQARAGQGERWYFDTVDTFVTLMLVGRWLQERLLARNRRYLLEDAGADGIHVRRRDADDLRVITAPEVKQGDLLVIAPGDLVPVDAELVDEGGAFSTDWINGESKPRSLARGGRVPAGSFNAGEAARQVRALTAFHESPLPALLRARHEEEERSRSRIVEALSKRYVPLVLGVSALGLLIWWPSGPEKALEVTVALLVVTCPCAVGIALPLARELALARLRRAGVFVRAPALLDRALDVRKVLFDKTGTLSLGALELSDPQQVTRLDASTRDVLRTMTARSNHPASRAIAGELARRGARFDADAHVVEVPGHGLELVTNGVTWRLGRPSWVGAGSPGTTALSRNGALVTDFALREAMRLDARQAVQALQRDGLDVWLVSGDAPARVEAAAHELGVRPDRTLAAQTPESKAEAVRRLDRGDALFVGDGVNDSLAFEAATCTGTPAAERPVMPSKADFFLVGEGIGGVREVLRSAQVLRAAERRIVGVALTYNLLAIVVSLLGVMTPLLAAVAMPLSSLSLLLMTTAAFRVRATSAPAQEMRALEVA